MLLKIFQRFIDHSLSDAWTSQYISRPYPGDYFPAGMFICHNRWSWLPQIPRGSVPVWGPMFDRWAQWWWRMCRGQNSVLCLHHPVHCQDMGHFTARGRYSGLGQYQVSISCLTRSLPAIPGLYILSYHIWWRAPHAAPHCYTSPWTR